MRAVGHGRKHLDLGPVGKASDLVKPVAKLIVGFPVDFGSRLFGSQTCFGQTCSGKIAQVRVRAKTGTKSAPTASIASKTFFFA